MAAIDDIIKERVRQIQAEGYSTEHDDEHAQGELAQAAACYCMPIRLQPTDTPFGWPWHHRYWNPKSRRRNLVRAAALIVAEIERLDRLDTTNTEVER